MHHDQLKVLGFRHELEIIDLATGEVIEREVKFNRIPQEGVDFLIRSPFGEVPAIQTFYCGLFTNNFVPVAGTTAADIPQVMGEFTGYSEAARPEWVRNYNGAGLQGNSANKAVFTPVVDASAYGSFIVSNPVKGAGTGLVLSVARFSTVKPLSAGLEARLVCGLTYIPTNVI